MEMHQACHTETQIFLGNPPPWRARFAFAGRAANPVRAYGCTSNAPTSVPV